MPRQYSVGIQMSQAGLQNAPQRKCRPVLHPLPLADGIKLRPLKRMFNMATLKLFSVSILACSALAVSAPALAGHTPSMVVEKTKNVKVDDIDLGSGPIKVLA
jgi:hypothetical protein